MNITSGVPVHDPGDALEPYACVDYLDLQLLDAAVVEGFELHKHHVAQFDAFDEVLDAGAHVASASSQVFCKTDVLWWDPQFLSEPVVVELNAFLLEKLVVVLVVEDLNAQHHESAVVSACEPNIIEVLKSDAELRAYQRVGWGLHLTRDAVRLKAVDARCYIINVVAPSDNSGVGLDRVARHSRFGERFFKRLPSLAQVHFGIVF